MGAKTFLLGVAAGAGLMYLLDPEKGKDRRARLKDQIEQRMNSSREFADESQVGLERERARDRNSGRTSWDERDAAPAGGQGPDARDLRDRAAEAEVTAFTENPGSIPSD